MTSTAKETDFGVNSTVWAKVPGYAWWPGKVQAENDAWINPKNLKPFASNEEELKGKNKTKKFLLALEEINDKSSWPTKADFEHANKLAEEKLNAKKAREIAAADAMARKRSSLRSVSKKTKK